ncbi:rhomboid family intramembrane serine protease [Tautonia sociabilis]|uniref:Rhomboid family intramembrane serine protease n=1 Tax=Tautonia sociabilis TaxID=2080755 RepID=A0A432MPE4_9BACT|nr:rhomboid family intramembrane serine protease [Tautonia sociabilis]RUL89129.1 rhomboid family intramembrane serine protease [Tautonia sociabilis]
MVMPLGDEHPTRIVPWVNYGLIATNILVFLIQASQPETFTVAFAATPFEITRGVDLDEPVELVVQGVTTDLLGRPWIVERKEQIPQGPVPFPIWMTLLTAMFLHGGLLHLAGNMLYLWIFGDNVEEALGHGRYLAVYLLCGLMASLAHIAVAPSSLVPSLGASGAIAGVMGMYLVWFPHNRVWVLLIRTIVSLPAALVIGLWIVMQLVLGMGQLSSAGAGGGVAYAAHIGGAAAGIFIGLNYRRRAEDSGENPLTVGWASAPHRPGRGLR